MMQKKSATACPQYLTATAPALRLIGAHTLMGNDMFNRQDEDLGDFKEIMLDVPAGRIGYAVLSHGGLLGMGKKLFAVAWEAMTLDTDNKRFTGEVSKVRLESAPGFDKDSWSYIADLVWKNGI